MKKKILSFVLAICMMVPCALLLTACGGGLKTGVDYKVEKAEVVWGSEEEKTTILGTSTEEEFLASFTSNTGTINFNEDGSMLSKETDGDEVTYYYTQEGDTLTIYSDQAKENEIIQLTVEGSKLVQNLTLPSYETNVKIYYVKA